MESAQSMKSEGQKTQNPELSTQTFGSCSSRVSRKSRESRADSEIHSAHRRSRLSGV